MLCGRSVIEYNYILQKETHPGFVHASCPASPHHLVGIVAGARFYEVVVHFGNGVVGKESLTFPTLQIQPSDVGFGARGYLIRIS
jgi:hypothetical protein